MFDFDGMRRPGDLRSLIPPFLNGYIGEYMDTYPRAIRHLLIFMAVCNVFLMLSSFTAAALPNMGFNTMIVSFLSVCHNVTIWMVMSNHRLPAQLDFVSNSNFAVGILLGTTIGMTVLMLMISTYYGQLSKCEKVDDMTISQYMCEYKGAMLGVWFWGGLLFWMDLILVVLLARGKDDLAIQENQYEDIGIGMESYSSTSSPPELRKFGQAGTAFDGDFPTHQNPSPSAQVLTV